MATTPTLSSSSNSLIAGRTIEEVALRNIVGTIMKDINDEMELLTRVLPDIEITERRRRLLFWTERSRHHVENLSRLCQWIMKYQPTLDAIDQMYRKIKIQRTLVEKSFVTSETVYAEGWQRWSRAPDVASSIAVLHGGGKFPFLPTNIFAFGGVAANENHQLEETSEYEQLKYERFVQRQLISEKVPVGGRLVCTIGGLVELSSPHFFVAFLVLKTDKTKAITNNTSTGNEAEQKSSDHVWEVKGVEVLVNGVLDFNKVGCPSEKDLEKITACANSVAYQKTNSTTAVPQTTPIERIYSCISVLVSSISMKILQTQAMAFVKSKHMGMIQAEVDPDSHSMSIHLWMSTAAFSATPSSSNSSLKARINQTTNSSARQVGAPVIEIKGQSVWSQSQDAYSEPLSAVLSFGADHVKFKLKLDPRKLDLTDLVLQACQICIKARLKSIAALCQTAYDSLVSKLLVPKGSLKIVQNALLSSSSNVEPPTSSSHKQRLAETNLVGTEQELSCAKVELQVNGSTCCLIAIDVKTNTLNTFIAASMSNSQYHGIQAKFSSILQSMCLVHQLSLSTMQSFDPSKSSSSSSSSSITSSSLSSSAKKSFVPLKDLNQISDSLLDIIRIGHIQLISSLALSYFPCDIQPVSNDSHYDGTSGRSRVYKLFNFAIPEYFLQEESSIAPNKTHARDWNRPLFLLEVSFDQANAKPVYALVSATQKMTAPAMITAAKQRNHSSSQSVGVGKSSTFSTKFAPIQALHRLPLPGLEFALPCMAAMFTAQYQQEEDHGNNSAKRLKSSNEKLAGSVVQGSSSNISDLHSDWLKSRLEKEFLHALNISRQRLHFILVGRYVDMCAASTYFNNLGTIIASQANGDAFSHDLPLAISEICKVSVCEQWVNSLKTVMLNQGAPTSMELPLTFFKHLRTVAKVEVNLRTPLNQSESSTLTPLNQSESSTLSSPLVSSVFMGRGLGIHWSIHFKQDMTTQNDVDEKTVHLLHNSGCVNYSLRKEEAIQNICGSEGREVSSTNNSIIDIALIQVPLEHGIIIIFDHLFKNLLSISDTSADILSMLVERTKEYVNASLI